MANSFLLNFRNITKRRRQAVLFSLVGALGMILIIAAIYMAMSAQRFLVYEDTRLGIRIKYPENWGKVENQPGVVVAFLSPQETDLDIFNESVNIVAQDLSQEPMTLNNYTNLAIRQMQAVFKKSMQVIESTPTLLAGHSAHKFVYQGSDQKNPKLNIRIMHIWCIKNNMAYQVTYTALVTSFDRYLKIVNTMLGSFAIK
mgnify:CR=1 FL=1